MGEPLVVTGIVAGLLLLAAFVLIERRVRFPMFRLSFFRIRMFAAGNPSGFLYSVAQGGLQFMLIIWLQGIWLPLHGYNYEDTPLWAGIYMSPMLIGFFLMGPLSRLAIRPPRLAGARHAGLVVLMAGFLLLVLLPADFSYPPFMLILILVAWAWACSARPT